MPGQQREDCELELATNLREVFTITEKAPIRTFSWLKASTSHLHIYNYAEQAPKHGK